MILRARVRRRQVELLVVLAAACFSISAPPGDTKSHVWRGIMGRTGAAGSFRLTSSASGEIRDVVGMLASDATISAPLPIAGSAALGQWNTSSGELKLTVMFLPPPGTLTATTSGGYIFGQYTGFSTGPGGIAGFEVGPLDAFGVYCGTSTIAGSATPRYFSFAVRNGQVAGLAEDGGALNRILGAVLTGPVTVNGVTGDPVNITYPELATTFSATGALNSTAAGGTFDAGAGISGTWIASACRAP